MAILNCKVLALRGRFWSGVEYITNEPWSKAKHFQVRYIILAQ